MGNGDGSYSFEGELSEHVRFQSCLITDNDEIGLVRRIAKEIDTEKFNYTRGGGLIGVIEEDSELDKLKKVILENNETRISHLQKIMKININKLNTMMVELCEIGFLEKGSSRSQGYRIVENEEKYPSS